MNSTQYEELCRFFLAQSLGLSVNEIQSVIIPNPSRPDLPEYKHQIDLYWELENDLALYLHVANAKWRSSEKVDQPEVLLLQKVKEKVAAHKAMMLTPIGFTAGAVAAAKDDGIALHVIRPQLDVSALPRRGARTIQAAIQAAASQEPQAVYSHQVEHRAFDLSAQPIETKPSAQPRAPDRVVEYATKAIPVTRGGGLGAPASSGGETRGGPPPGSTNRGVAGGRGGYSRKG